MHTKMVHYIKVIQGGPLFKRRLINFFQACTSLNRKYEQEKWNVNQMISSLDYKLH